MSENENTGEKAVETAQAVKVKAKTPIINGRLPVVLVYQIRFGDTKGEGNKTQAARFGTTVGKIDDIRKGRNFAYVTVDFRPTQEQVDAGVAWLKQVPEYDKNNVDGLILELEAIPLATADEASAFEAVRAAARGQTGVTKTGEPADAGGGNRREPRAPKEKVVKAGKPGKAAENVAETADALLA